ncbi:conjugal transfer protein TraB [Embleya sp. NBC_00896]|uniref:conjugal transfer protein TraB n=1 Tax=Embleya sp. NBC_00896 TaxID=2975961 RepID=UPI002F911EFE|nr:conjugal transfer protein TraB [Embleya sp. NBC_00896]
MSNDLALHKSGLAAIASDGDNSYRAVQEKLGHFARTLDDLVVALENLHRTAHANARRAAGLATDIEHADLDPSHVAMTTAVAGALEDAAAQVDVLRESAQEVSGLAYTAKGVHARLYAGLNEVREGRRETTPKPGFLAD